MSKVWSPSQTADWSRCPRFWDFGRRWERFSGGQWTPERVVGDALHAGIAAYLRATVEGDTAPSWTETAITQLRADWPTDAPTEFAIEGSERVIERVLGKWVKWYTEEFAPTVDKIVAVEWSLPGAGGYPEAQADAIFMRGALLHIVDWKYHANLKREYVHYRVDETERMHAMWHYSWRVSQHFGRHVGSFSKVMLVGAPATFVKDASAEVTPEALLKWEEGAWSMWRSMDLMRSGAQPIHPRWEACGLYGGCPFYDGCWRLAADETKFDTLYKRKVWGEYRAR